MLLVRVHGSPAPKGSKRFVGMAPRSGRGIMIESSKKEKPWRSCVTAAVVEANASTPIHFDGAVRLTLQFVMPRVKSEPRATRQHTRKPDIEKLCRSVSDAISDAGVWADDACVVELTATKVTAEPGEPTGCTIMIEALPSREQPKKGKPDGHRKPARKRRAGKQPADDECPYFV
jgi:Holliday junction resolvase RusA-like endonuclease